MRRNLIPVIYEIVSGSGAMDDAELLNKVKRRVPDVTVEELDNLLLRMEVEGLVAVTHASRDVKRVEALNLQQQPEGEGEGENEKGDVGQ